MNVDWVLFRMLNGLAGRSLVFDRLIQFLMNDYALTTALSALVVVLWFRGRTAQEREADQTAAVHTIIALLLASVVLKLLNLTFYRPRPFTTHDVNLIFYHPSDSSLPSNSATVAFIFALGAGQRSRALGAVGVGLGVLLGLSRIVGGVHYPLDIVAGAALGSGAVLLVHRSQRIWAPVVHAVRALARPLLLA